MLLSEVKGHEGELTFLRRTLKQCRIPNAIILEGQPGVGKRFTATRLAASALCQELLPNQDACGECKSCRVFRAGIHPDYKIISTPDEARVVKIEELQALVDAMSIRAQLGERKVALIPNFERISERGQNTILKTLEEPSGEALFILTTPEPSKVLPTIRSRVVALHFGRLSTAQITELLEEHNLASGQVALDVASISRGSFMIAKEAARESYDSEMQLIENIILPRLAKGAKSGAEIAFEMGVWFKNRKQEQTAAKKKSAKKKKKDEPQDPPIRGAGLEGPRLIALRLCEVLSSKLQQRLRSALASGEAESVYAAAQESVLASSAAIVQNVSVEMALSTLAVNLAAGFAPN